MHRFDLYVTSIPDDKAKFIIARHIAAVNPSIPLHTAMSMAEKPPLLLLRNLELKEAEQHIARLKRSGIGFKVVESKVAADEQGEVFLKSAAPHEPSVNHGESANSQQSMTGSHESVDLDLRESINIPETIVHDKKPPDEQTVIQEENAAPQESTNIPESNPADDEKPHGEQTAIHEKSIVTQESAGISKNDTAADDKAHDEQTVIHEKNVIARESTKPSPHNEDGNKHPEAKTSAKQNIHTAHVTQRQIQVSINSIDKALESEKKKSRKQTVIFGAVFVIAAAVMLFLPKEKKYAIKSAEPRSHTNMNQNESASANQNKKNDKRGNSNKNAAQKNAAASQSEARKEVTSQQRQQANAYVDSAKTLGGDVESVVAFYKAAISFNQQNLAAWQGLLQAYRDLGKEADARQTEERMREIFGDKIESVSSIVKPFGELIDTYINDDGTYRVEYRSGKRSKTDITADVFLLTRAIRTVCSCENVSIYASTGAGKGLLSHSGPNTSVHSLSAFSNQAQIIWLD